VFYALTTLWYERNRYFSGVVAVAFSAVLVALQMGLLLGNFSFVSTPVDLGGADIWVGSPGLQRVDQCLPIPEEWQNRLAALPGVTGVEVFLQGYVLWSGPGDKRVMCLLIGTQMDETAFGPVRPLDAKLRRALTEPGSVVVDESEAANMGISEAGQRGEVAGQRCRVVGFVSGVKGLGVAYLLTSLETARHLLAAQGFRGDQVQYILGRCPNPADAARAVRRLSQSREMSAYTREELSWASRWYWLTRTKGGLTLGCSALLGVLVGAAVTSQTLYAATAASLREYAVLEALGIPTWRMAALVLAKSFWIGVFGLSLAIPIVALSAYLFEWLGTRAILPDWLWVGTVVLTLVMALVSGLLALPSLRLAQPAQLLR
jgi:putative ABC transport system permease protein